MRSERQRAAVLRVMCLALMMVVAAVASLNVALPGIARDTGASQTQLQWIVDAYALVFAALLLPAGAIGDRFGRKRILSFGLIVFGGSSLGAIFLHSPSQLIAWRALMGIGAAGVMPVTLSVITTIFPREERGKAVGTWVGVAAGGGVVGLLISGLLLQWLAWPSVFGLNVALAALALAGTLAIVPATEEPRPARLDPVGTAISVGTVAVLVYAIIEAPDRGWSAGTTILCLAAGAIGATAFVLWELRRAEPMLDPRHFLRRGFAAGSLSIFVQFFAAFGFLFLVLPYLQLVKGYAPLHASASILPMALVVIPLSRFAPAIAGRVGVRVAGAAGLTSMATGFVVLSTLHVGSSYWHFLAGLLPFGAGMALSGAPATTAIVASLPREKQGVASAVNDVSRELGGAFGIAVLGSVMNSAYRANLAPALHGVPEQLAAHARSSLAEANATGVGELARHAESAYVHGFSRGLLAGAVWLAFGAIFVAARAQGRRESAANASAVAAAG